MLENKVVPDSLQAKSPANLSDAKRNADLRGFIVVYLTKVAQNRAIYSPPVSDPRALHKRASSVPTRPFVTINVLPDKNRVGKKSRCRMTETQIYIADVACLRNEKLFAECYGSVNKRRQAKIDRMRFYKDKRLSLGAEVLLQQACRDFGISYKDAFVAENKYGKPYFTNVGLEFNLSHSGERVMCIMSEQSVGCDVGASPLA